MTPPSSSRIPRIYALCQRMSLAERVFSVCKCWWDLWWTCLPTWNDMSCHRTHAYIPMPPTHIRSDSAGCQAWQKHVAILALQYYENRMRSDLGVITIKFGHIHIQHDHVVTTSQRDIYICASADNTYHRCTIATSIIWDNNRQTMLVVLYS